MATPDMIKAAAVLLLMSCQYGRPKKRIRSGAGEKPNWRWATFESPTRITSRENKRPNEEGCAPAGGQHENQSAAEANMSPTQVKGFIAT
jgi:hypothetical protein